MSQTIRISRDLLRDDKEASNLHKDALAKFMELRNINVITWSAPMGLESTALRYDIQDWFKLHNTHPRLSFHFEYFPTNDDPGIGMDLVFDIDIPDPDVALLFKLTWGGA